MATFITIDIGYSRQRYISVPDRVTVTEGEAVLWKINLAQGWLRNLPGGLPRSNAVELLLYFPQRSPFTWYHHHHRVLATDDAYQFSIQELAQKPGEYKYGMRMTSGGETKYDEDPWLIVKAIQRNGW